MTGGSAVGAPVAGFAIDHGGWPLGFVVVSSVGVLVALVGVAVSRRRRKAPAAEQALDSGQSAQTAILEH